MGFNSGFKGLSVCVNISSIKRIFSNQSHYFLDIPCITEMLHGGKTVSRGVLVDMAIPCYKENYLRRYFLYLHLSGHHLIFRFYLSPLTLYIPAFGTTWSLLGSPRKRQVSLHRFKRHLLYCQYIHNFNQFGCF